MLEDMPDRYARENARTHAKKNARRYSMKSQKVSLFLRPAFLAAYNFFQLQLQISCLQPCNRSQRAVTTMTEWLTKSSDPSELDLNIPDLTLKLETMCVFDAFMEEVEKAFPPSFWVHYDALKDMSGVLKMCTFAQTLASPEDARPQACAHALQSVKALKPAPNLLPNSEWLVDKVNGYAKSRAPAPGPKAGRAKPLQIPRNQ